MSGLIRSRLALVVLSLFLCFGTCCAGEPKNFVYCSLLEWLGSGSEGVKEFLLFPSRELIHNWHLTSSREVF